MASARLRLREAYLAAAGGPVRGLDELEILSTEEELKAGLFGLIRGARNTLAARFYRVASDSAGLALVAELVGARERGVAVRLVLDAVGSMGAEPLVLQLRRAGCGVEFFNPLWDFGQSDPALRDHAKVAVADARRAWVASANVAEPYFSNWHDCGIELRGALAPLLELEVDQVYRASLDHRVPSPQASPSAGTTDPGGRLLGRVVANGFGGFAVRAHVLEMLRVAERTVSVHHCYLTDTAVVEALARRAREGLRVDLIVPRRSDVAAVDTVMAGDVASLAGAGVRYFLWPEMSHRKFMMVDGDWMLFGSSNLDGRSLDTNLEVGVAVLSSRLGRRAARKLLVPDIRRSERVRENALPWWMSPVAALLDAGRGLL